MYGILSAWNAWQEGAEPCVHAVAADEAEEKDGKAEKKAFKYEKGDKESLEKQLAAAKRLNHQSIAILVSHLQQHSPSKLLSFSLLLTPAKPYQMRARSFDSAGSNKQQVRVPAMHAGVEKDGV